MCRYTSAIVNESTLMHGAKECSFHCTNDAIHINLQINRKSTLNDAVIGESIRAVRTDPAFALVQE